MTRVMTRVKTVTAKTVVVLLLEWILGFVAPVLLASWW
jgi:hypothetical protein